MSHPGARPPRRSLRPAIASIVLAIAACHHAAPPESASPPLTIGEPRVMGAQTMYVLDGRGYELVAPSRELLPEARGALDAAGRQFRDYFSVDPDSVTVRLEPGTAQVAMDSAHADSSSTVFVPLVPGRASKRDAPSPLVPLGLAPRVANAWFLDYVNDAARAASGIGRPRRIADWLRSAAPELIASNNDGFLVAQLSGQHDLMSLRQLFMTDAPPTPRDARLPEAPRDGDGGMGSGRGGGGGMGGRIGRGGFGGGFGRGGGGGGGRGGYGDSRNSARTIAMPPWLEFRVQSLAVARFFAEREGPDFIGHIAQRMAQGATMDDVLQDARVLPHDVDAVDEAWREWLQDQHATAPRGRRAR